MKYNIKYRGKVFAMKNVSKLSSKEKVYIAQSIRRAYKKCIKLYKDNNLTTNIGKPYVIWDFIYSSLNKTFKNNAKILLKIIKNGSWNQIILFNSESKVLYFIMKESRYVTIKKQGKSKHLLAVLSNLNENKIDKIPKKISNKIYDTLQSLPYMPNECILITFDYDENSNIDKYKAYKLKSNLQITDLEVLE